ncbi:amidase [Nonomuraea maritima]|uniref:amidase n=1 Tax=Nonomuraea maritima TaxID=683260 RepID=UPI003711966D
MAEVWFSSAAELVERLRRREVSAVEVLDAHAERIARHNPSLVAVVSADLDRARQAAAEADRRLARDGTAGPLHGVPMVLKDGHDVAGMRTTLGTDVYDRVPDEDGTVAARLRAAGAIIVGHSNVPPFLAQYRTENEIFGRSGNPWDPRRTPGGSSGGGAAAVAAGLAVADVGSDYGGSLRLPPHFCGVYGLMATERRVPATGFWRPLDGRARTTRILMSFGPMARDVADLDLVLRVIAGPDGRDGEVPPVPLCERRSVATAGLRLAVAPALPGAEVAAPLRAQVERVAVRASDAGAHVTERLPKVDWGQQRFSGELMSAATAVFDPDAVLPDAHRELAWYLRTLDRRDRFRAAWHDFFAEYDALVTSPGTTTAFVHDSMADEGQERQLVFANFAGLPVLTAPAGHDGAGLPIGVQIVGPPWSEVRLVEIAHALEESGILPGFTPPPGY